MSSKVYIITPAYNSEKYISDAMNSVIAQTYTNWELLIIDDGSIDTTIKIVEKAIVENPKIQLLKNKINSGAAISRNRGIEAAKGSFIAFLDADDVWKPNKLQVQIDFMTAKNCDVCFSSYEQIDEAGKPLNRLVKALPVLTYKKYLKSNYIGNLTGIYNAKTIGKIMAPKLRKRQDWLLWLEVIKTSGKPALGIQDSLAYYRVRKNSMSSNKFNLLKHNYLVYRKGLGFSVIKSVYRMSIFLIEHFFVKSKRVINLNEK